MFIPRYYSSNDGSDWNRVFSKCCQNDLYEKYRVVIPDGCQQCPLRVNQSDTEIIYAKPCPPPKQIYYIPACDSQQPKQQIEIVCSPNYQAKCKDIACAPTTCAIQKSSCNTCSAVTCVCPTNTCTTDPCSCDVRLYISAIKNNQSIPLNIDISPSGGNTAQFLTNWGILSSCSGQGANKGFDPLSGIFTVPATGTYSITAVIGYGFSGPEFSSSLFTVPSATQSDQASIPFFELVKVSNIDETSVQASLIQATVQVTLTLSVTTLALSGQITLHGIFDFVCGQLYRIRYNSAGLGGTEIGADDFIIISPPNNSTTLSITQIC